MTAYLTPVLLLCVECREPIKATITTERWIKVEWISPDGLCQQCNRLAKEKVDEQRRDSATGNGPV